MVLVGTDEIWARQMKYSPPNKECFNEVTTILQNKSIRFEEITDFMKDIKYADSAGHPARQDYDKLAQKFLDTFKDIISCARREAG